jgi:hypothetical protein
MRVGWVAFNQEQSPERGAVEAVIRVPDEIAYCCLLHFFVNSILSLLFA